MSQEVSAEATGKQISPPCTLIMETVPASSTSPEHSLHQVLSQLGACSSDDQDSNNSPKQETPSVGPPRYVFSRNQIISKRLLDLSEDKAASPLIFAAATRGDCATVSQLLANGIDCDIPGPRGRYLVHIAAISGSVKLLTELFQSQKKWSPCSQQKTALDYASFHGHKDAVSYLIESSGLADLLEAAQLSTLERATGLARSRGHADVAKILLDKSSEIQFNRNRRQFHSAVLANDLTTVEILHSTDVNYENALRDACKKGHMPIIRFLILSMHRGFFYDTSYALEFASREKTPELLALLLSGIQHSPERVIAARNAFDYSVGAGIVKMWRYLVATQEISDKDALHIAALHGNLSVCRWLVQEKGEDAFHGNPINLAFHTVILEQPKSWSLLEFLIENGADVNSEDEIWGSALQRAVGLSDPTLVEFLISHGANAKRTGPPGKLGGSSAVVAAVSVGKLGILRLLLAQGACLKNQHGTYGNLLQTACFRGHGGIVEELLNRGFDANSRLDPCSSPLVLAVHSGKEWIVELLISRGADVNVEDPKFGTALHLAAQLGAESMVKSLIQGGADVDVEGGEFCTPLQAAAAEGYEMIVLYLLDCGADINIQGGRYGNALKAAQVGGHALLAKLLLFSGAKVIV